VHSPFVEQLLAIDRDPSETAGHDRPTPGAAACGPASSAPLDVAKIYREHADFLWRSLQHLGVQESDLEDVMQEVLVVVHRRRESYDGACRLTSWLFGICLRIVSQYRRRAHRRREQSAAEPPELPSCVTPETQLVQRQTALRLESILELLSLEQRATFVLFEIEGQSCQAIAELFAVPLGTVYSRLHTARSIIQERLERERRINTKAGRQ
jgi:RNA polymerase sigma-70 factor (ECF subfamily)